tara:strand:+ start:173 stop:379 length:207 start_codon:yes stop_codon:yes gene_type:complete
MQVKQRNEKKRDVLENLLLDFTRSNNELNKQNKLIELSDKRSKKAEKRTNLPVIVSVIAFVVLGFYTS